MRATRETAQEQPDGTWIVGLRLDADDALRLVSAVALGHPLHVALPGQDAPAPASRAPPPVQHVGLPEGGLAAAEVGATSMDAETIALMRAASAVCESPRFHRWLIDHCGVDMGQDGAQAARDFMLARCNAREPAELMHGKCKAQLERLMSAFKGWEASAFRVRQ